MKYEYRVYNLDGHDPEYQEKLFNELGIQGYELVTVAGDKAYFKRSVSLLERLVTFQAEDAALNLLRT